jgi:CO dehydrogenase maturation factor
VDDLAKHIAFAGKGGTGKTTIASLLIRYLVENKKGSVIAVDADPNSTLNDALGVPVPKTISKIIDEAKNMFAEDNAARGNFLKEKLLAEGLLKYEGFDLMVLGGPQGEGCYCIPMSILKNSMEMTEGQYDYMVIDNEAGMEYLSRDVIERVDIMLVIADATVKGVRTTGRIYELAKSLGIEIGKAYLVITKTSDITDLQAEAQATGLEFLGVLPYNQQLVDFDLNDKPLMGLPSDNGVVKASAEMFAKII